ncbi:MAG: ATP-binding protein [Bdellovibrionales bacterium]|nr:ATP-binding protein [Bdellovibrionales bacterium]
MREPLESGEIVISRRGQNQTLPARFLLLATTNLCHCGRLVPERRAPCRFSLTRCRSYLERMVVLCWIDLTFWPLAAIGQRRVRVIPKMLEWSLCKAFLNISKELVCFKEIAN